MGFRPRGVNGALARTRTGAVGGEHPCAVYKEVEHPSIAQAPEG